MTARMEIFFNGTGLVLPFNVVSDFNKYKKEQVKIARKISYQKKFEILFHLQKQYNDYIYEERKYNVRRYIKTSLYGKIFEKEFGICGINVIDVWSGCIISLVEEGKLKENEMNGFRGTTFHSVKKEIIYCDTFADINKLLVGNEDYLIEDIKEKKQTLTNCIVCDKPSKHRCRDCYVFYCSSECQKTDWPNHKNECVEIKKTYKPRSGKSHMNFFEI
jgi:hypothetical protein